MLLCPWCEDTAKKLYHDVVVEEALKLKLRNYEIKAEKLQRWLYEDPTNRWQVLKLLRTYEAAHVVKLIFFVIDNNQKHMGLFALLVSWLNQTIELFNM